MTIMSKAPPLMIAITRTTSPTTAAAAADVVAILLRVLLLLLLFLVVPAATASLADANNATTTDDVVVEIVNNNAEEGVFNICDKSKCRTELDGPLWIDTKYACLAPDQDSMVCADDYVTQDLSSVGTSYDFTTGITLKVFTCCRPGNYTSPDLQECTDTACTSPNGYGGLDCWADGPHEPMTCDVDTVYKYPRKTGTKIHFFSRWYTHYVCCTTDDGSTPPLKRQWVFAERLRITLASFALFGSACLILAILLSKDTRSYAYNSYIIALSVSECLFSVSAINMGYLTLHQQHARCKHVIFFGYCDNAVNLWINAILAHHIYHMLRNSSSRRRYNPPTLRRVWMEISIVYVFAIAVGVWTSLLGCGDVTDSIHLETGRKSTIIYAFTWILFAAFPLLYFMYICFRIWYGQLLPRSGRSRVFSLYFLRIMMVFFVFWIPTVILVGMERQKGMNGWNHYTLWYLNSTEGILAVGVALTKPDVLCAVLDLFTCRWWKKNRTNSNNQGSASDGENERPSLLRRMSSSQLRSSVFSFIGSMTMTPLCRNTTLGTGELEDEGNASDSVTSEQHVEEEKAEDEEAVVEQDEEAVEHCKEKVGHNEEVADEEAVANGGRVHFADECIRDNCSSGLSDEKEGQEDMA